MGNEPKNVITYFSGKLLNIGVAWELGTFWDHLAILKI